MSEHVEFIGYALTGKSSPYYSSRAHQLNRAADPKHWSDLHVTAFQPKTFADDDVELAITHCGVCGSDVHTLTQGWGASKLPLVVGHEIVGTVTRVGRNVADIKVSACVVVRVAKSADGRAWTHILDGRPRRGWREDWQLHGVQGL